MMLARSSMPPRAAWRLAFVWLAGAILIIGTVGLVGVMAVPDQQTGAVSTLAALNPEVVWHKWDTLWYERVAVHGYAYQLDDIKGQAAAGYFPLYPLLVGSILRAVPVFSFFWTGTFVSTLSTLTALALMATCLCDGATGARRALTVTLTSAGAFYLLIPYTEGLFLLLVVLTMVMTRRRHYLVAGACAGLAAVTRVQGLALIAVPILASLSDDRLAPANRRKQAAAALLIFAIPFAIYLAYMARVQGSAGAFVARQAFWGNATPYPFRALVGLVVHPTWVTGWVHGGFWVLSIVVLLRYWREMTLGEALFCAGALLISTQQEIFQGIYRYVTPLVPLTLAIANDTSPYRTRLVAFNIAFAILMMLAFVTHNRFAV